MPLAQLYQQAPMRDYAELPYGLIDAMGHEGYLRAMEQQRQLDESAKIYNRQVVNEANPAIIQQQQLANQQQQYMMPTYEAQGLTAKEEIKAGLPYQKAQTGLATQRATQATQENERAKQLAIAPTVGPTAKAQAEAAQNQTELFNFYTGITSPEFRHLVQQAEKDKSGAKAYVAKRFGKWAPQLNALIDKHGPTAALDMFISQLEQAMQRQSLADPAHYRKIAEIQETGAQNARVAGLKQLPEKEYDQFIEAYMLVNPKATRLDAHKAWITARYQPSTTQTFIGPDGKPLFIEQTTKNGGAPQAGGTAVPKTIVIQGTTYEVLGVAPDGSVRIKDPKTGRTGIYNPSK